MRRQSPGTWRGREARGIDRAKQNEAPRIDERREKEGCESGKVHGLGDDRETRKEKAKSGSPEARSRGSETRSWNP